MSAGLKVSLCKHRGSLLTCYLHQGWLALHLTLGGTRVTLARKFLQRVQNLGTSDVDCNLFVFTFRRPDGGNAVLFSAGLHFLPVAGEVDRLSVSHSTCQAARSFFSRIRLLRLLQKHWQCKFRRVAFRQLVGQEIAG